MEMISDKGTLDKALALVDVYGVEASNKALRMASECEVLGFETSRTAWLGILTAVNILLEEKSQGVVH